jgi:two-component system, chemotaxis family, sensor kinase CheA
MAVQQKTRKKKPSVDSHKKPSVNVQKKPPVNLPAPSFDDALSMLVQIDPENIEAFRQLSEMLNIVCSGSSLDEKTTHLATAAIEQIDMLVNGETTDAEEVLIRASKLLEDASNTRDAGLLNRSHSEPESAFKPAMKHEIEPEPEYREEPAPAEIHVRSAPIQDAIEMSDPETIVEEKMSVTEREILTPVPAVEKVYQDSLPHDADLDLLGEFVAESRELLEKSESALLALENNPDDPEAVNTVFRAFHTVKGTSGFLGLKITSELAHLAESLLSRIRNKEIHLVGGYADLALRSLDMLKKAVNSVERALHGSPLVIPPGYAELQIVLADPEAAGISEQIPTVVIEEQEDQAETFSEAESVQNPSAEESVSGTTEVKPAAKKAAVSHREGEFESSIRVNTARLDRLIDMVGELVIAQSMVVQDRRLMEENCHELLRKVTHASKIVRELQDLSMSMRMVPLRGTFQKMQRVARDLARKSGKSVELVTDDGETEIDRHMVDILNDVLVHMVRNAIDHGIESMADRESGGKSQTGTVRLTAFHSGGTVVVEIRDDGRGLNREKILRKAIAAGIVDPEKPLSDNEVFNLIFAPGLSTSETVTDVSGRGVGMDVVRKGVEALHGRIDINTAPGAGSTFTVRLPLTLAITDGMLVRVGCERYIIPTISIHLCFRPTRESLSTVSGRGELVMLRGEMMPIFRLHRLFGIDSAIEDPAKGLLVVVGDEERRCALLVDELLGQQQVVAKSLTNAVGKVPGVSGGAILGDGQVGLILDPGEVAAQARQTTHIYGVVGQYGRPAA